MTSSEVLNTLQQSAAGLLFMSESDYPFEPILWQGQAPLTAEKVLQQTEKSEDAPIETLALQDFFEGITQEQDWFGEAEKATAAKYRQLLATIENTLADVRVYRVGEVEIDVYIIGTFNASDLIGLSTKVIET